MQRRIAQAPAADRSPQIWRRRLRRRNLCCRKPRYMNVRRSSIWPRAQMPTSASRYRIVRALCRPCIGQRRIARLLRRGRQCTRVQHRKISSLPPNPRGRKPIGAHQNTSARFLIPFVMQALGVKAQAVLSEPELLTGRCGMSAISRRTRRRTNEREYQCQSV